LTASRAAGPLPAPLAPALLLEALLLEAAPLLEELLLDAAPLLEEVLLEASRLVEALADGALADGALAPVVAMSPPQAARPRATAHHAARSKWAVRNIIFPAVSLRSCPLPF
jgi:hypothetical protein